MKTVLITGANGGIGSDTSNVFLREGYRVVGCCYPEDFDTVSYKSTFCNLFSVGDSSDNIQFISMDVSDYSTCESAFLEASQIFGNFDVLVNCAGVAFRKSILETSPNEWHFVINTNMSSVFYLSKLVLPHMISNGFGRIISISSVDGQKGEINQACYSASKSGIDGFTKALAREVAQYNITANIVSPGYIDTDMFSTVSKKEEILNRIPLRRIGNAKDVSNLVYYLASESGSYITGAIFSVNGGLYI